MENWKEHFGKGKEVTLATSSLDSVPNANIVISLGFVDDKILLSDCQMVQTISNLKDNPRLCLISGYHRIRGIAEIHSEGEFFEMCRKENEGSGFTAKNALLVVIGDVFDLDGGEVIFTAKK